MEHLLCSFLFFFAVGDPGPVFVPLINAFTTLFEGCFAWVVQLEFFFSLFGSFEFYGYFLKDL